MPCFRCQSFLKTLQNFLKGKVVLTHPDLLVSLSLFVSSRERFAVIGGGSLRIVNLTEEDAGIYVCQADSGNMTSEIQAELTVHGTFHKNLHTTKPAGNQFSCE